MGFRYVYREKIVISERICFKKACPQSPLFQGKDDRWIAVHKITSNLNMQGTKSVLMKVADRRGQSVYETFLRQGGSRTKSFEFGARRQIIDAIVVCNTLIRHN